MIKDDDPSMWMDNHQAEDLSAKMARKSKPIPPPLNLSAMGDSDASSSPLKDFAMLATSPRSPLVQKNLPFRKRAHSYSSTQTSSECDSPESPRVPASPLAMVPSPSPFTKSPLSSPSHILGNRQRYLHEPIKSLLPSPNTSASFFNNECDPIKSPCLNFYRPTPDLLPIPIMEKNLKSPLQTPTRSVFLQNHVDTALFFTDMDKLPLKSPLNTPTPRTLVQAVSDDVFVMPEPISVKTEPVEPEKENLATDYSTSIKAEPMSEGNNMSMEPPLDLAFDSDMKQEKASHDEEQLRSREYSMNYYLDSKIFETFANKRIKNDLYISHSLGLYCSELTNNSLPQSTFTEPVPHKTPVYKPITYRKANNCMKRPPSEKPVDEAPKKTKKEIDDERPRRPMNAFMLFAKHQRPLLIQQHPGKDNRAISVVLGTAWRELDAAERAEYVRRAAAMALEHKRLHPDCWKRRRVRVAATATNPAMPAPPTPNINVATSS